MKPLVSDEDVSAQITTVNRREWGVTTDGEPAELYVLDNGSLSVAITTFGARIVSLHAQDKSGVMADVVLGYDNLEGYEADIRNYMGATIGRYANRIGGARFQIDSRTFAIETNGAPNALHGGAVGFDRHVWSARKIDGGVEMTRRSPDGEMGFPGTLDVSVQFVLRNNALHMRYKATTDAATVVNLTNHAYFNLAGHDSGVCLDHVVQMDADKFAPIDEEFLPLGNLAEVKNTALDFREPRPMSEGFAQPDEQMKRAHGFDHNFVLRQTPAANGLHRAAKVTDPASGRTLEVFTTEPGVQLYSGNFLDGADVGKSGARYGRHAGFCLETQHFPDSPNHPQFPSTRLNPGDVFHSATMYILSNAT